MNEAEVSVMADQALLKVVQQIRDDQWDMLLPDNFTRADRRHVPTLREIINYLAYEDAWAPDMLAGKTMAEAGIDNFKGDLLGADPKASFAAIVEKSIAAARNLDDPDKTVHCSFGDFKAREYLWQTNGFRGLRAHDIAKVIGVSYELDPRLVEGLWEEIAPHAEEWRAIGVFEAAVPIPEDAPLQDRLLGITGRQPDHSYPPSA